MAQDQPVPKFEGKGKGKVSEAHTAESKQSSKDTRSSVVAEPTDKGKGKGKAKAAEPAHDVPDYEDAPAASRLHEDIPTDMPEPRRLQRLIELAIEAEQAQMARLYTGQSSWISRCAVARVAPTADRRSSHPRAPRAISARGPLDAIPSPQPAARTRPRSEAPSSAFGGSAGNPRPRRRERVHRPRRAARTQSRRAPGPHLPRGSAQHRANRGD